MAKLLLNLKKKRQTKNSTVFIMRPSCTLKFQFVFGFNQSLWGIFSLLNFENVRFYIWVLVVWLLILRQKWLQVTSYPYQWIKKIECKGHQIYPKMLRKIFQNEVWSQFHRVIKHSSFDQYFLYIWSKPFQKLFGDDFLFPALNLSTLAVQLYHRV